MTLQQLEQGTILTKKINSLKSQIQSLKDLKFGSVSFASDGNIKLSILEEDKIIAISTYTSKLLIKEVKNLEKEFKNL